MAIICALDIHTFLNLFIAHSHARQVPKKLVIIGAGYIAVEFASIFHGLGSEVHLVFRKDLPLNGFDEEVGPRAAEAGVL